MRERYEKSDWKKRTEVERDIKLVKIERELLYAYHCRGEVFCKIYNYARFRMGGTRRKYIQQV